MKILLWVLISLMGLQQALADVCITDVHGEGRYSAAAHSTELSVYLYDGAEIHKASLTCRELDNINTGVQATSLVLSGIGIYTACTGVGLPASVALEGGALFLTGLSLVISNLDCEDTDNEQLIEEKVDAAVCLALEKQGIQCIPPLNHQKDILSI